MDGPGIDQKIRFGYAKAAKKLGADFSLYRATNAIDPIVPGNLQGIVKCAFTVAWDWMRANRPGNSIWYLLTDGQESSGILNVREMDFLVSAEQTFFVLAKQYQMPMLAVECNAFLTVLRPTQSLGVGRQPYAGYTPQGSTIIVQGMPASNLLGSSGKNAITKLPEDMKQSGWNILMPHIDSLDIKSGDIALDQDGQYYLIALAEKTDFGWRMRVNQMVT